jgi:O-antigen ligase
VARVARASESERGGLGASLAIPTWRALVPAAAVPIVFLHLRYQPRVELGVGSTRVGIELSDVAVLIVVGAAVLAGLRYGWEPLRAGRRLWLVAALFLGLLVAATFHPLLWQDDYSFLAHLVTAATFCEYALLAPSLALLLRRSSDAVPLLWAVAIWSVVASGWGLLQFVGLVRDFEEVQPLRREPSFVGIHDFAALSGAAFALGLAVFGLDRRRDRALGAVAGVGGAVGLVLAGSLAAALGIGLAGAATLWIARTRGRLTRAAGVTVVASCLLVVVSVPLIRSAETTRFLRDLGLGSEPASDGRIESYGHRSLLAYIGVRIFLDHPVLGVGWQGSQELENYGPYLADAQRRYPDAPDRAFPSPEHAWGTQNAYLQTLTDLGLVGLVALLALAIAAVALGLRAAVRAPPGILVPVVAGTLWLLVAAGVWNGMGLVAGIPLDALTWLGLGLVAAAAVWTEDARAG